MSQDAAFLAVGDRAALGAITKVSQEVYLANPQHLNSYSYAFNNPLTYRDPDGNFAFVALGVLYAPQIIAGAGMAAALAGALIASWQWGAGVGYMMEGNHAAANASFDASISTSAVSGTFGAGLILHGMSMAESAAANRTTEQLASSAKGGVYKLTDPDTGAVMRTCRTNDLVRRQSEHANDPALSDLKFTPAYRTDNYAEQRGLEQVLHQQYGPALNKIAPISPSNPNLPGYMKAAENYVKGL